MMSKVLCIVQARMGSSRLPGKILKTVVGKELLAHQLERLQRSKKIDQVVVATTTSPIDDATEKLCKKLNIQVFRGSEENVLRRFYDAACCYGGDHIVRITADCPLIDWEVIDEVIDFHFKSRNDYSTNCLPPTYPDGLDMEIFKFQALKDAAQLAVLPSHLEHVTPFIRSPENKYVLGNLKGEKDLSHLRWTVDQEEDFLLVKAIYEALWYKNPEFLTKDILQLLEDRPELLGINSRYARNEGSLKSKAKDEIFLKSQNQPT